MKRVSEPLTVPACLPVVPAGMISLKYLTTSVLTRSLASLVRQRIHFSVSGFGSSSEASSSCRLWSNLSITSFGGSDVNWRDSLTLWGKTRDSYPFPKISKNNDSDKQNEPPKNLTVSCQKGNEYGKKKGLKSNNQNGKETKAELPCEKGTSVPSLSWNASRPEWVGSSWFSADIWIWQFPAGVLQMKVLWWVTILGSH